MPSRLRIVLVVLLVGFVLLTGVPLMMGGSAMACETCPATSVMSPSACVAVLGAAVLLFVAASPLLLLGRRREQLVSLLVPETLERPPQMA